MSWVAISGWFDSPVVRCVLEPLLATADATAEVEAEPMVLSAVLLSLVVIYLASKIGGEICARIDLPPVLGELIGGVVVGISALHLLVFPEGGGDVKQSAIVNLLQASAHLSPAAAAAVSHSQSEVISILSELGVVLLLFEIGLESDLKELLRVGIQSTIVATVGVVVPFALGTAGLMVFFQISAVPAIFAGAALTATSIGITARVLAEIQRLSSREGQIIIGAAVIDDILGIIVLAVVASLAREGNVEVANVGLLIISASVFLVGSIWVGRLLNPYFVSLVDGMKTRGQVLITALIAAFFLSYVAGIIQLEAILGAFACGLVLAETEKQRDLQDQIKPIADMFVPIFFVVVGARTDISVLNPFVPENREGLLMASFLIAVAILGKIVTGLSVFGQAGINRWAIGVGMIPRGEVGLVFAAVGSASGALSKSLEAAIIVMVILTTFLAPPLLRVAFSGSTESSRQLSSAASDASIVDLESDSVQAEGAIPSEDPIQSE